MRFVFAPEGVRVAVLGLFAAWIAVFAQATILVALQQNLTLLSAATAVAATLNVIGLGLGQVGAPKFSEAVNAFCRRIPGPLTDPLSQACGTALSA